MLFSPGCGRSWSFLGLCGSCFSRLGLCQRLVVWAHVCRVRSRCLSRIGSSTLPPWPCVMSAFLQLFCVGRHAQSMLRNRRVIGKPGSSHAAQKKTGSGRACSQKRIQARRDRRPGDQNRAEVRQARYTGQALPEPRQSHPSMSLRGERVGVE